MLFSQFILDGDKFVISANQIAEIVPMVSLKSAPFLPDYVAGLLNYHGEMVPVLDLCSILVGRKFDRKLSTRIIIVESREKDKYPCLLGLVVEKATEMIRLDDSKFHVSPLSDRHAMVNGPIIEEYGSLIAKVTIEDIFSKIDQQIFSKYTESSPGMAE